jgi:TolB protein
MKKTEHKTESSSLRSFLFFIAGIAVCLMAFILWQETSQNSPVSTPMPDGLPQIVENNQSTPEPGISPVEEQQPLEEPQQSTPTFSFIPIDMSQEIDKELDEIGVLAISMMDGIYHNLFIYHPHFFPLTRLTNGNWDDVAPAFSNDGSKLAYASNQNGRWDIYLLDLRTYELTNITNSNAYDMNPGWSPDDQWLVFDSDRNGNRDIFLQSVANPDQQPLQLTLNQADEFLPTWSPDGRKIAYTSLESGNQQIWIADLDKVEGRFMNLSQAPAVANTHPFWSTEGQLFWHNNHDAGQNLVFAPSLEASQTMTFIPGSFGTHSPNSQYIAVVKHNRSGSELGIADGTIRTMWYPYQPMPGRISGISWGAQNLDLLLPLLNQATQPMAPAEWNDQSVSAVNIPNGRSGLIQLQAIKAPYPYMQSDVSGSFLALKQAIIDLIGWDFLATLNNAYMPITDPSSPHVIENWFYTGRAFEIDPAPATVDWLVITKEDIDGKVFWRIYLRPINQSGAVGRQLQERVWSFDQRSTGSPEAYEQGGSYSLDIPSGYWVDFTELAAQYGWVRMPALNNWRTYYPGTQHTVFVNQALLDLDNALLDLYPPEALLPPATNSVVPIRLTPTPADEDTE